MANETLLIIEDEHDIAEVLRIYLSGHDYTVWVANTGAKGIELAKSEHPSLIILDDTLPDMTATEVTREIRSNPATENIPIIFFVRHIDKIAGLELSADDFITKPFELEEVNLRIKNAIDAAKFPPLPAAEPEPEAPSEEASEILDDLLSWAENEKKADAEEFGAPPPPQAAPIVPPAPAAPVPAGPPPPPPMQPAPAPYQPMPVPAAPPPAPVTRSRPITESGRSEPIGGVIQETRTVQFRAYHPPEIVPDDWKPLVAYVYYDSAENDVQTDAGKQLGVLLSSFRKLTQAARNLISEGANITATPSLPGFQFNPPSATVAFYENWHRFDFKMRAKTAPLYQAANGTITFTVEGIIVGDVPLSVYVTEKEQSAEVPTAQASSTIYNAVFCSYSRKDLHIIQRVEKAYKALGMDYLRDMTTLRSGEYWNDELKELIDRADIFQLFWSPHSSISDHVRMEWEYALKREHEGFIRPVYWTQPIPNVPDALSKIHFAYQPDLVD